MSGVFRESRSPLLNGKLYWWALPLLIASGVAAFLFYTNRMIPFSNDGHCDPWFYFGYFYVADQFSVLGDTRIYSRLPLTLIGFVTSRIFHSVSADYVNFMILFSASCIAVYSAAITLFSRFAAVIATIFFATSGIVIGNFSVTYTAPDVLWSLLAIAFAIAGATATTTSRKRVLIVLSGLFWGTAVIGHLYSLTYNCIVPLYTLQYMARPWRDHIADALRNALLLVAGILSAILVFGLISRFALHGGFFFFLHQFEEVFNVLVADFQKPNWFLTGGKGALIVFGCGLVVVQGAVYLCRPYRGQYATRALTALVPLAALLALQLGYAAFGGITLEYDYYYVWMVAPIALALALLVDSVELDRWSAFAIAAIYTAATLGSTLLRFSSFGPRDFAITSLGAVAVLLATILVMLWRPRALTLCGVLLLCAALSATIRPERMGVQVWQESSDGSAIYARLREGWEFLRDFPFPTRPKFWISTDRAMGETVSYPRGYRYCLIDTALPKFLPPTSEAYNPAAEAFEPGDYMVMAAPDPEAFASAKSALQQRGLTFDEQRRKVIDKHGVSYLLIIGRLEAKSIGR